MASIALLGIVLALLLAPAAWAAAPLLFRDVRIFDGSRFEASTCVLVIDGRIASVGPGLSAPDGARIIEGRGRTLLPGLIDAHTHTLSAADPEQALRFGVTTELDMFTLPAIAGPLKLAAGNRADLRTSLVLATAPGGHGTEYGAPIPTLSRPEEAEAWVSARVAEGADYIKIVRDDGSAFGFVRPSLDDNTMRALIEAAHRRGKLAVVHISTPTEMAAAVRANADVIAHVATGGYPPQLWQALEASRAAVTPTLTVVLGSCLQPGAKLARDVRIASQLPPAALANLRAEIPRNPKDDGSACRALPGKVAALAKAGTTILAGTDALNPGTAHGASLHGELELLVEAGLTPGEALRAATSAPARVFRLGDRGRIAADLRADLILIEGDPARDITATRNLIGIWKLGVEASVRSAQ